MGSAFFQKMQRVKGRDLIAIFKFLIAVPVSWIVKRSHRDLWLICDSENEARDNGYAFFRYLRNEHPDREVIYAINQKSPDVNRVKEIGPVVHWGSLKHWVYYLVATANISSQKEGKPNAAVCYVLEVYGLRKNFRVFLQHGVIHNDLEFLHYKNSKMSLFLCSTEDEYNYIKEKFGYPEGAVVRTGLSRFDNLVDRSVNKKQILIMPTWRSWIGNITNASYQFDNVSSFTNTEYYQAWSSFLRNPDLMNLLEEHDINMVFYPHRRMQPYLRQFASMNERIRIAGWPEDDVQELLCESNVLITDYSSIAMDFAMLQKPLIYYQFDYEKFRKGQYSTGYFSYEKDGFGPVCTSEEDVIKQLWDICEEGMLMPGEYRKKVENFFPTNDYKNSERVYGAIVKRMEDFV